MKKHLLALLLSASASFAQSITIPAQTFNVPITINGTTVQVSITVPAQTVALPAAGLPTGISYSSTAGLTVAGAITASGAVTGQSLAVTGGTAIPACSGGLYLFSYTASTNTLTPSCYTPPPAPAITVSQASGGGITLTPSL